MKTSKILFLSAIISVLLSAGISYAQTTVVSYQDQNFTQNDSFAQLYDITITDDLTAPNIKAGVLKITIPYSLSMIFDDDRTIDEIVIYGSAVDSGKVLESPAVTFADKDKTLVIHILQDFEAGDTMVITRTYVKGFHGSPGNSDNLVVQVNNEETTYKDTKTKNILTSTYEDTYPPELPSDILIVDAEGGVKITWTDPTDLDLQNVQILRGISPGLISGDPYIEIARGLEEFIDTDLKIGDEVKYILRSTDGRNLSANSEEFVHVVQTPATEVPVDDVVDDTVVDDTVDDVVEEPVFCTLDYNPVCGVDGKTYSNECVAVEGNKVEVDYTGECLEVLSLVSFSDTDNHWAAHAIELLSGQGIINGDPEGTFRPDDKINRAEASALFYRILGLDYLLNATENPFPDVELDQWYTNYIFHLKSLGLINGNPNGTFRPSGMMNRAEFLFLAMNVYNYMNNMVMDDAYGIETNFYFKDLNNSDWYTDTVNSGASMEFIEGKACNGGVCFFASDNITRAEAVTILANMFY